MRDQYINSGQGFLLVYSVTSKRSFETAGELKEKIIQVKERDNFPIVLCGNKCDLEKERNINEEQYGTIRDIINGFKKSEVDLDWLKDTTEKFCKDKAIYNAIVDGIKIIDGKDGQRTPEAIPEILTEALGVCFDNSVGHDYLGDSENRFD